MSALKYNWMIGLCIALFVMPPVFLAYISDPIVGDLTRLGYFPENDYGWNAPQIRYRNSHFDNVRPTDGYDIVVLGDSFSLDPNRSWVNTVASTTGLRIAVQHHDAINIFQIAHDRWDDPPQLYIFETAERRLFERMSLCHGKESRQKRGTTPLEVIMFDPNDPSINIVPELRPHAVDLTNFPLGYYIKKVYSKYAEPHGENQVLVEELKPHDLFTSVKSNFLLYYINENKKRRWPHDAVEQIKCGAAKLNRFARDVLRANFLLLVMPDKSSIYAEYAINRTISSSRLHHLKESGDFLYVDLYEKLRNRVRDGEVDVYLPNDSHVSGRTHKFIGEVVVDHLVDAGVLKPGTHDYLAN